MLPFLRYKEKESDLQAAFGPISVTVESIDLTDNYYTDGEASRAAFKIIIDSVITVYVPQFFYKVDPIHKKLIKEWMGRVEELNTF